MINHEYYYVLIDLIKFNLNAFIEYKRLLDALPRNTKYVQNNAIVNNLVIHKKQCVCYLGDRVCALRFFSFLAPT